MCGSLIVNIPLVLDTNYISLMVMYFIGFARIAAESDRDHPPIRWVLPPGLTARTLSGVFTLDWINR